MPYTSINPVDNQLFAQYDDFSSDQINQILDEVADAQKRWESNYSFSQRSNYLLRVAKLLKERSSELGLIITREMGKIFKEAKGEVEKCASVCEYYALNAEAQLQDEIIVTDASKSYVHYQAIGVVFGIMPWNFPFWQVFRYVAPSLMLGNACLLKHASNVPQCAMAIEKVLFDAGLPEPVFRNLLISSRQVEQVIASPKVHAVTLTGSEPAGRKVASLAGYHLKKSVLELGGSDPFIVLKDANLDWATDQAIVSRFLNCGQSCIAAKRFIVVNEIADAFFDLFKEKVSKLKVGNPEDESTQIGPMARVDLRDEIAIQVNESLSQGAINVIGCQSVNGNGSFYLPSILGNVTPSTRAWSEEFFGPVALAIRAESERHAIEIANSSRFGLGGSIWSEDSQRAEQLAKQIETGSVFINGFVKSDPRLPFGGIKDSGYGRELSLHGLREFTNTKTIWIK